MENNCKYVCSRGLLKSCTFHSPRPTSSWCYDIQYLDEMINGNKMFDYMSIYLCTDVLPHFVEHILPRITNLFYLISGDSDATVPKGMIDIWHNPRELLEEKCLEILNHPKLIKWWAQNCILNHDKIAQLPIGLDYHTISNDPNKNWRTPGEGTTPNDQENILIDIISNSRPFYEKVRKKIYVNFSVNLNNSNCPRTIAINNIPTELLHIDIGFKHRTEVWKTYSQFAFILSPYGGGLDCHRTWEILCLGSIPIVKSFRSNGVNDMFDDLPVLIVNEWNEITEQLLNDTIEKFKNTVFNYDKLTLSYWTKQFTFITSTIESSLVNKNPFEIEIFERCSDQNDSENGNNKYLLEAQSKLDDKRDEIVELIKNMYPYNDENYKISLDFMIDRCSKSVRQKLIDVENNIYPSKTLYKIGNGGDHNCCFVCSTPLSNNREEKSKTIRESLENVGFNGHFYLFNGDFPTPRGGEMKYAAVPYCFKIFMMLEAKKLGFNKVIWLDSACYAVNNVDRLFDILEHDDAIFRQFWPYTPGFLTYENTVFKETIQTLDKITNGNLVTSINVCSIVFGMNFGSDKINQFVEEYYDMVKLGTPFLSYYPEEVVITAIFNKPEYKYLFYDRSESHKLFIHETAVGNFENAKNWGYYFVQRSY